MFNPDEAAAGGGVALTSVDHPKAKKRTRVRKPAKKKAKVKAAKKRTRVRKPAKKKAKVKAAKKRGNNRPLVRTERLDMRLTKPEKAKVSAKAKKLKCSITDVIVKAIASIR